MKHFLPLALSLIISHFSLAQTHTVGNTTLTEREVVGNLDVPWEIKWGPDNHLWITERDGIVSRVNVETGDKYVILDLSSVLYDSYESGLLGMEIHPEFNNGAPYVFLAYTYGPSNNPQEKIVAYEYDSNTNQLINETVLVDNIDANSTHIGCRLLALDDLTMLITTGDAQLWNNSQNVNEITGKTLRISINHQDGTFGQPAADNPNPNSSVYTIGHRNAQGLAIGANGIIYSSEHGPSNDDELNIIQADANYGWPNVQGFCDNISVDYYYAEYLDDNNITESEYCNQFGITEPLWSSGTSTIAPSDIIWYDHPAIPEFQNTLLMTVLKNKKLVRFQFSQDGHTITEEDDFFVETWGRLRDICVSPDGRIYLATNGYGWPSQGPNEIIELSNNDYYTWSCIDNACTEDADDSGEYQSLEECELVCTSISVGEVINNTITIYPNPAQEGQLITFDNLNTNELIAITDLRGKNILTKKANQNGNIYLNKALPAGVYLIHTQAGYRNKLIIL